MQFKILREAGYEEALLGLSLSFYDHQMPLLDWEYLEYKSTSGGDLSECRNASYEPDFFWTNERFKKAQKIALHLATKTPPDDYETRNNWAYISAEQKFLESIDVWIFIQASIDYWCEFDTYRVDMTKQSSSTMHTLSKRFVTVDDFEKGTKMQAIDCLNVAIEEFHDKDSIHYHNITRLKKNNPSGWLQERVVKTSYKTLKWIIEQRDGHRLEQWKQFNSDIMSQLEHPKFIKEV
jgi:hypothetical protein